jgi:Ca2+-binding EF-hand superfamily protein
MFNRRVLVISMLLAGYSLAASSFAQEPGRDDGVRAEQPRGALRDARGQLAPRDLRDTRGTARAGQARMLRQLDSNGDKLISLEEFTAKGTANYERQFTRADRDDDGLVSEDEARPRRRGPAEDIDVAALRECIAENGGLAEGEEDRFAAADKDGDGALSQEEFFMQLEQRAFDQFARMDADADGQLTGAELAASMQGRNEQRRIVRACIAEQIDPFL